MTSEALWPQSERSSARELVECLRFRAYLLAKRCLDLFLAPLMLIVTSPLLLITAALVKIDSPGPVIFAQQRVGARWQPMGLRGEWQVGTFRCYKFRTMYHGCDQSIHEQFIKAFAAGTIDASKESSLPYKLSSDRRVTRVGRWLRKSSMDELPQLLNILYGEMSLVGPRPVPTYEVAQYRKWHKERLDALPGLTGLWQVKGRSLVTFDEMVKLDIEYIRNRSILLDLKILLATIPAVLFGSGAG